METSDKKHKDISYNQLERENRIMRKYFQLILDIGYDYDGYRTAENLMKLIDEIMELAEQGLAADDKKVHYSDLSSDKNFNILLEEIKDGEE